MTAFRRRADLLNGRVRPCVARAFAFALYVVPACDLAHARRPRPAVAVPPAAEQPAAAGAPADVIPRETLVEMFRAALGKAFDPAHADTLVEAHALAERYFEAPGSKERKAIVGQIEATGVDANALGRVLRIRSNWPKLEGGAVYYTNERHGPHDVRYFLGLPKKYARTNPWPLVIRLPTAGAFLTDPPPTAEGVVKIYTDWIKEELDRHPDAAVLMPLLNLDELYGPGTAGMNTVVQPLLHAAGRANVDPARVYLVGHSMSAHAAWNLALHYPTYFAAFNPLAGAASGDWQRLRLMNLSNVLPVVWHDANDEVIKVGFSRSLVKSLRGLELDVEYEETKGVGHAPTEEIAERQYGLMRARTRELYPRSVMLQSSRADTMFNRADWVQVYQPLRPGKERRLLLRRGSGFLRVYEKAFRLQASVTGPNRIDVRADNVSSMRFYLNDALVDMTKPVTVTVNKKVRFEGLVKPGVEEMLKDQVFLGRGWRYFTGVVDVELDPAATTQPTTKPTTRPTTKPVVKTLPPRAGK